jgi:hypothetical protein
MTADKTYNAAAAHLPTIGPVPGLIPWWGFLAGHSNATAARSYMRQLTPAFNRWRTGDPELMIELALTLPYRLAPRVRRHEADMRRWLGAAVLLAAGATGPRPFGPVTITVTYDPHVTGWGEAAVHLRYPITE